MARKIQHFALRVWGDFACFTRPEMKVERVSYDVMTPSAARGILEAICWKPQFTWIVDRIHVMKPIRFTNLRRNEVKQRIPERTARAAMVAGKGNLGSYVDDGDNRQQRAATILRDVRYIIEAHFEMRTTDERPEKYSEMFRRRAGKGQYFHHPYLGCREFVADFELVTGKIPPSELSGETDLGFMLHDIDFENDMTARFFRAVMRNGVIDVPRFQSEALRA
ncbi:MAG: type I-C CRISPR-associated protein Cas5c [Planctomycetota bacterium]